MARRFLSTQTRKLVLASHNPGKLKEIAELLAPFGIEAISAGSLGIEEPEETGATFAENASLKALNSAKASNQIALSDDSGLCVDALDGVPGIYSARWAGPAKNFASAMQKIKTEIEKCDTPQKRASRQARFVCALALAWPDGHVEIFEGSVEGELVFPPRGDRGFGYDPIFVPDGESETFGEMNPTRKHEMSHRARAFDKLMSEAFGSSTILFDADLDAILCAVMEDEFMEEEFDTLIETNPK